MSKGVEKVEAFQCQRCKQLFHTEEYAARHEAGCGKVAAQEELQVAKFQRQRKERYEEVKTLVLGKAGVGIRSLIISGHLDDAKTLLTEKIADLPKVSMCECTAEYEALTEYGMKLAGIT